MTQSLRSINATLHNTNKSLSKELKLCNSESSSIATWMYKKFYSQKPDAVGFELCDSASGMMTQIDNMSVGILEDMQDKDAQIKKLTEALDMLHLTLTTGSQSLYVDSLLRVEIEDLLAEIKG